MNERATQQQILSLFPNASRSTLAANAGDTKLPKQEDSAGKEAGRTATGGAELERRAQPRNVGKRQTQKGHSKRFLVRVTRCSRRLLDEDNIAAKFVVDCCRYSQLLDGDAPSQTKIEITQRKISKEEAEHVTVEIFEL